MTEVFHWVWASVELKVSPQSSYRTWEMVTYLPSWWMERRWLALTLIVYLPSAFPGPNGDPSSWSYHIRHYLWGLMARPRIGHLLHLRCELTFGGSLSFALSVPRGLPSWSRPHFMRTTSRIGCLLPTASVNFRPGRFPPTASTNLRVEPLLAPMDFRPGSFLTIFPGDLSMFLSNLWRDLY